MIADVGVVRKRSGFLVGLGCDFAPDRDELIRFREWQWPEQNGVDHAEDRAVRADAESESQNGDGGETGRLRQQSHGVSEISEHYSTPKSHFARIYS